MKTDWKQKSPRGLYTKKVGSKLMMKISFQLNLRIGEQIMENLSDFIQLDINETKRRDRIFG